MSAFDRYFGAISWRYRYFTEVIKFVVTMIN